MKIPSGTEFLDPAAILKRIGLTPGMVVADLGCGGAGYFTIQAAREIGGKGKVFAVDVFRPALSAIEGKARLEGLTNIETVWSNLEIVGAAKQIRSGSIDFAMLHNVLYQSQRRRDVLKECMRMLKMGGKLLVIDWRVGDYFFGPKKAHLVSDQETVDFARQAGLRELERFEPGRYHWAAVFAK